MATKNFDFNPQYYDLQVDWKKRFEKEKDFYDGIFSRTKISSVLDIGCGTGHHAEFFAGYADRVVAVDPDQEMIDYAGKNIIKSPKVTIYRAGFEELDRIPEGKFDLITSLGNTIAILGDKRKIKQALKSIKNRLSKNGIVLLQLNTTKLLGCLGGEFEVFRSDVPREAGFECVSLGLRQVELHLSESIER